MKVSMRRFSFGVAMALAAVLMQAFVVRGVAMNGALARRALVFVVSGDVDEVILAEAPLRLRVGGHRQAC